MSPVHIAFRCDGNETVGAGHVGRCLPIAAAARRAGHGVTFVGDYSGVAAMLLDDAAFTTTTPGLGAVGLPPGTEGAIVDHYGIHDDQIAEASQACPVVAFRDLHGRAADGVIRLDYHLDAAGPGLCGPDFAPVDPKLTATRDRPRGGSTLVALGGSTAGREVLPAILDELLKVSSYEIALAGELHAERSDRVRHLGRLPGLAQQLAESGALVCGAGVSAYEGACAGIPTMLVVLADNQERVGHAFTGLAPVLDARVSPSADAVAAAVQALPQAAIAVKGPALVDGLGGARVRDALLAAIAGRALPPVQRYRPATTADSELLLSWRNDPRVREVSRETSSVAPSAHATWLREVLADPKRNLLVVERAGVPVATVRFDRAPLEAEISVTVAPEHRGMKVGTQAIAEATELELASRPHLQRVVAEIGSDNEPSIRSFNRAGYQPTTSATDRPGAWLRLEAVR